MRAQRVGHEVIRAALPGALPVEQGACFADDAIELRLVGGAVFFDQCRDVTVRCDIFGSHRKQRLLEGHHAPTADFEIKLTKQFAVRTALYHQHIASTGLVVNQRGAVEDVVGVGADDHVDAADQLRVTGVDLPTHVRQQHDQIDLVLRAQPVNVGLYLIHPQSEGPLRVIRHLRHPVVGHADDGDLEWTDLFDYIGLNVWQRYRLIPLGVVEVGDHDGKTGGGEQTFECCAVVKELHVARDHRVVTDRIHDFQHRPTVETQGNDGAMPGVTGVEYQGAARKQGTLALDERGDMSEAAHTPFASGMRNELVVALFAVKHGSEITVGVVGPEDAYVRHQARVAGRARHGE